MVVLHDCQLSLLKLLYFQVEGILTGKKKKKKSTSATGFTFTQQQNFYALLKQLKTFNKMYYIYISIKVLTDTKEKWYKLKFQEQSKEKISLLLLFRFKAELCESIFLAGIYE